MGLALRKEKHYTYADYLQWPDEARYELIDGEAFLMSPAPLVEHQEIAGEVFRQLANQLDGQPCRPYIAPVDVRLPRKAFFVAAQGLTTSFTAEQFAAAIAEATSGSGTQSDTIADADGTACGKQDKPKS